MLNSVALNQDWTDSRQQLFFCSERYKPGSIMTRLYM